MSGSVNRRLDDCARELFECVDELEAMNCSAMAAIVRDCAHELARIPDLLERPSLDEHSVRLELVRRDGRFDDDRR